MFKSILKKLVAKPVPEYVPAPVEIFDSIWAIDRLVSFPGGARLPARSVVTRLNRGSTIVLTAPPCVNSSIAEEIAKIGPVEAIIAPNTFHYVFLEDFVQYFPKSQLFYSPGLSKRVSSLPDGKDIEDNEPAIWSEEIETYTLHGAENVSEVLFFHRPSATLVVTDLVFNIPGFSRLIDKLMWATNGIPVGLGPGRTSKKLLLCNRHAVAGCVDRLNRWPFQNIVVSHGDIFRSEAKSTLLRILRPFS